MAADGGKIFVMDGEAGVSAHDGATGAEVWRVNLRPNDNKRDREAFGGGVAYAGGKLYVSSGYRLVAQLDAATGKVGWITRTEQPIHAAPTVSGGRVLVVSIDNTLMTFDAATGVVGWTYQALSETARILGASSPAVSGGHGGGLLRLGRTGGPAHDQRQRPVERGPQPRQPHQRPVGDPRHRRPSGDLRRRRVRGEPLGRVLRHRPAHRPGPLEPAGGGHHLALPEGDVVYVMAEDGQLICASRESGQIYWMTDLNAGFKPSPPRRSGFLKIGGHKVLKPIWTAPLLANNRLIMAGPAGELVSLNAKTGAVQRKARRTGRAGSC